MRNLILLSAGLLFLGISGFVATAIPKSKAPKHDMLVTLETKYGDMKIILYDLTPGHKENFLKLVDEGFYDSTTFHRVIGQFMIQGGDPNSKDDNPRNDGLGGPGYTIPAEFDTALIHKKGALAAARQGDAVNPEKASSGSQFYIVQGRITNEQELNRLSMVKNRKYSPEQKKIYAESGGTPHLDGDYTVFGEVISGMDIIDSIASVRTGPGSRPLENIYMRVSADKVKRKKITKNYGYEYPENPAKEK